MRGFGLPSWLLWITPRNIAYFLALNELRGLAMSAPAWLGLNEAGYFDPLLALFGW